MAELGRRSRVFDGRVVRQDGLLQIDLYDTDSRFRAACKHLEKHPFAPLSAAFSFIGTEAQFKAFAEEMENAGH
jgi:hypothetical protein